MSQSPDPEAPSDLPSPPAESEDLGRRFAPLDPAVEVDPLQGPPRKRRWLRWPFRRRDPAVRRRRRLRPRDSAVWMRGTSVLVVIGFCIAAFIIQMTGTFRLEKLVHLREFVNRNQLAPKARLHMLALLAAGAACGVIAGLVLYRWPRRRRVRVDQAGGDHAGLDQAGLDRALLDQARDHAGLDAAGVDHAGLDAAGIDAALLSSTGRDRGAVTEVPISPTARAGRVLRTARLFSPLLLPGLARPLLMATEWDALSRISGIAFVAFLTEMCFRAAASEIAVGRLALARSFSGALRAAKWWLLGRVPRFVSPLFIVLMGAGFYAVWMSYGTILQHRQFGTAAFDLGNYDTMFFNALHGHPFRCLSVLPKGANWSMLSNHAELTLYVLLPFYALHPGPETLLVLQAVALATGAIPLYRFAARRLPRNAALVLALAYLAYPPMHQANFYDIHFQPFAVTTTLWALDMLDARRPILFSLFFVLALGCREDVPIGFVVLGAYLLLTGKHTRAAIAMSVVATAYFVVIKFLVMPHFGSWWFSDLYKDLYPTGENTYGGVVKTLLTNPSFVWKTLITTEKMVLFLLVLGPIVLLPLRRGLLWMSLLPAVPFTVLTTGYGPTVEISFQYILLYVPFLFSAAAVALATYRTTPRGRAWLAGAVGGIAMATFLTTRVWGAMPPGDKFRGGFRDIPEFRPTSMLEKQKARDIAEMTAKIPKTAPLAISEMEHAHASTRLNCLDLRSGSEGADYLLYSEDSGGSGADFGRRGLESGEFELVERRPETRMVLLRRKKK